MSEPCSQLPSIEKIQTKLDQMLEALQVIAVQKNEIEHLIKTQGDQREWLKGHERRIQDLEKLPGDNASRFIWLLYGGGVSSVTGILVGLIVFFITKG